MALEPKPQEKPDPSPKPGETQNQKPDQSQQKPDEGKKPERGSIYDDLGVEEPGKENSTSWAATWREDLAAGDDGKPNDKHLAALKRFDSPKALAKSYLAAVEKLRSGEYKRVSDPPPKDADPKVVAAWREEQGLPKAPTEFQITAPGIKLEELDETDRGHVQEIQNFLFENNYSKAQGDGIASYLMGLTEKVQEQQANKDASNMDALEDELRADWGADYRNNQKMNVAYMKQEFGDDWQEVIKARMPNGTRLADTPMWAKFINKIARAEGGDSFVRNDDNTGGKGIDAEIAEIEKIMETNMPLYLQKHEKRYGELLAIKEKKGQLPD